MFAHGVNGGKWQFLELGSIVTDDNGEGEKGIQASYQVGGEDVRQDSYISPTMTGTRS